MTRPVFWALLLTVAVLSLMPTGYLPPQVFSLWDKAQHAIAFGVLAVLAVLAYPEASRLRIALLLMGQGVLIEVLQHYGGYRFGDWQDAVADGVGVLVGLVVVRGFVRFIKKSA